MTPHGMDILKNFLFHVADAPPSGPPPAVIEEETARIRSQVGSDTRALLSSGGVDSRWRRSSFIARSESS